MHIPVFISSEFCKFFDFINSSKTDLKVSFEFAVISNSPPVDKNILNFILEFSLLFSFLLSLFDSFLSSFSLVLLTQSQFQRSKYPEIEDKYENIIKKYENTFSQMKEENYNAEYDKNFLIKNDEDDFLKTYNELKSEVDMIEKDLNFYKENKEQYKSIVPIETSIEELNKLKYIISYIESSTNFEKLKKINEIKEKYKLKIQEDNYDIFNKKLYNDLDEQLETRLNKMKKLKMENPAECQNFEYELFLSPNNEKMKQYKQLDEIVLKINKIEEKIGKWNTDNKKNTICSMLDLIKINLIFYDKVAKSEIVKKFDNANLKLDEIKENYQKIYDEMDQDKIKDLMGEGINAKEAEKIINNIIAKMELLKDEHEQSIYLSQKVKELINKNEEIKERIESDTLMLEELKQNVENNANTMKKNIEIIKQKMK